MRRTRRTTRRTLHSATTFGNDTAVRNGRDAALAEATDGGGPGFLGAPGPGIMANGPEDGYEIMIVRLAKKEDLDCANELRRQVNELHASRRPDVFRQGFPEEMRGLAEVVLSEPEQELVVAELDGMLCGYAIVSHVAKPGSYATYEQNLLHIDEFGVDESHRRQGIATEMLSFIREFAAKRGCSRIELSVWEFNADAQSFYEAAGFSTSRRCMELLV